MARRLADGDAGQGLHGWMTGKRRDLCGRTGIRTLERVAPLTVFKTVAFVRSAILPARGYRRICPISRSDLGWLPRGGPTRRRGEQREGEATSADNRARDQAGGSCEHGREPACRVRPRIVVAPHQLGSVGGALREERIHRGDAWLA